MHFNTICVYIPIQFVLNHKKIYVLKFTDYYSVNFKLIKYLFGFDLLIDLLIWIKYFHWNTFLLNEYNHQKILEESNLFANIQVTLVIERVIIYYSYGDKDLYEWLH